MALPSQQGRTGMVVPRLTGGRRRRRGGRSGGGGGRRLIGVLLLLAGGAAAVWGFWPGDRPEPFAPGEMGLTLDDDASERPAAPARARSAAVGGPAAARPATLEMGRPAPGGSEPAESRVAATMEREPSSRAQPETPPDGTESEAEPEPPVEPIVRRRAEPAPNPGAAGQRAGGDAANATAGGLSSWVGVVIGESVGHLDANRWVAARDVLNRALADPRATELDREHLRARLAAIAAELTFSPRVVPDDATAETYVVQRGDALSRIPRKGPYHVDHRLIQRINRIEDPRRIRVGQRLKVLVGPMHAVVDKSDFRLDLYAEQRDSGGNRLFLRSFDVGLGEYGSTPIGLWKVRDGSKAINPRWVNPRTGEVFAADDPENPIGEYWIGLEGLDAQTELLEGYGIHGTIEPDSIGEERSMGCVRLREGDVALLYELLVFEKSRVEIVE